MTVGLNKGSNYMGHLGWITVRCRICATYLDLTGQPPGATTPTDIVYACPKCVGPRGAYFCHADARAVKYSCPYCGSKLVILTPLAGEE